MKILLAVPTTFTAVISVVLLLLSCLFVYWSQLKKRKSSKSSKTFNNSHIPKKRIEFPKLSEFEVSQMTKMQSVLNFKCVTDRTHCLFAKRAVLWGSPKYDQNLTISQNVLKALPSLVEFIHRTDRNQERLDGYVIELRAKEYGKDFSTLCAAVRIALFSISRSDPSQMSCMDMVSIDTSRWYFSLDSAPIFITVFSPCYSTNHPRYSFAKEADEARREKNEKREKREKSGENFESEEEKDDGEDVSGSIFILFQPEISFLLHGLDRDTLVTNWNNPTTVRERTRVAFHNNERGYLPVRESPANKRTTARNIVMGSETGLQREKESDQQIDGLAFWDEIMYPDPCNSVIEKYSHK